LRAHFFFGLIASFLLGLAYAGFCFVAAMYGPQLVYEDTSQILPILASLVLGQKAGILANITIALSCLTTALALTTIFSGWLTEDILKNKVSYTWALLITLAITTAMSHLGFGTIMMLIAPLVKAFYPALVMLAIVNIMHQIWGWNYIKLPVFATFALTLGVTYWDLVMKCVPFH
jgi:LIVCS family branched-chain amino acid:cation transporter